MKAAAISTLNPLAESYVPLALRDDKSETSDSTTSHHHEEKKLAATDNLKLKAQESSDGASSQVSGQIISDLKSGEDDDDFEMELAYLQMSFPGMSDQSVMDVYTVNNGDFDASLEMLNELESFECADGLPDALDIGDVSEPFLSGECSSTKAKDVAIESSSSSSGKSNLAIAS